MEIWHIIVGVIVLIVVLRLATGSGVDKARRSGVYPPHGAGSDADVERLVRDGQKILAIKLYRELHGVGLKDSKEVVDKIERDLKQQGVL